MDRSKSGQCVMMSFFRFKGKEKFWALAQMGLMQRHMKAWPGMGFYRLFGTGGGSGYSIRPNFSLYAMLTVWDSPGPAFEFLSTSGIVSKYMARSYEHMHLLLRPVSSRGKWKGMEPFKAQAPLEGENYITVITRARLKWWFMLPFWRRVKGVSKSQNRYPGQLFSQGVGALPWIEQTTFSVWKSEKEMMNFAFIENEKHRDAIQMTRKLNGFREEIYARLQLLDATGNFKGKNPFPGLELPLAGFLDHSGIYKNR